MTKDDCTNCRLCRFNHLYVLDCKNELTYTPLSTDAMSTQTTLMSDGDRLLRHITIWTWLPAFPFLLAHGIMTNVLCPVLGIIPMTISAFCGLVHLSGRAKYRPANVFVDTFTAMFLMGILIPGWVFMSGYGCWRCGNRVSSSIVGTYGTMPMIVNFLIHAFFVFREMFKVNMKYCPHCHGDLNVHETGHASRAMSQHSSSSKESYIPVTLVDQENDEASAVSSKKTAVAPASYNEHDYNQPRPSTDDETARLV